MLVHLSEIIDTFDFYDRWKYAKNEKELKELLLDDNLFATVRLEEGAKSAALIDRRVKDLGLPGESLITIVRRKGKIIFPHGSTLLKKGDELFIIGEKEDIEEVRKTYGDTSP